MDGGNPRLSIPPGFMQNSAESDRALEGCPGRMLAIRSDARRCDGGDRGEPGAVSGRRFFGRCRRLLIGPEHAQMADAISIITQPSCASLFEPRLEHMTVSTLDHDYHIAQPTNRRAAQMRCGYPHRTLPGRIQRCVQTAMSLTHGWGKHPMAPQLFLGLVSRDENLSPEKRADIRSVRRQCLQNLRQKASRSKDPARG
jgi:hypothetical protein